MEDIKRPEKVAVFVDLENFIGFSDELRLPFELEPVIKKLTESVGKVLFRRSFGDLIQSLNAIKRGESIKHVRLMLQANLIQHEDVPFDNRYKNSADMRLAVETLSVAFGNPEITTFAIVSEDRDYIPLFNKLREMGKGVIGISGNEDIVSDRYRMACDTVFYIEDLYKTQSGFLTEIAPEAETDFTLAREQYLDLLKRSITLLNEQDKKTVGGIINLQMRRMQSDFDPIRAGFDSFQDFIYFAKENSVVNIVKQGDEVFITLPGAENTAVSAAIAAAAKSSDLTENYRKFMESKLKQPLPSRHIRQEIYQVAANQISYNNGSYLSLSDLSNAVTDDLIAANLNISQNVIFKLLYTLHRADCFVVEGGYGNYDPRILRARYPVETWDEEFIKNALSLMHREMRHTPLVSVNLSELFYDTGDKSAEIEEKLRGR